MAKKTTLTDIQDKQEKVFLAGLINDKYPDQADSLEELAMLVKSAGAIPVGTITQKRPTTRSSMLFGKGKVYEIKESAEEAGADMVVVDNDLTPAQIRNLEKIIGLRILDRTELILDIFAQHARTKQAKLQVELAQLEYLSPRLKRLWTHLSRIEGGRGMAGSVGARGPGEKQLETDQRLLKRRIYELRRQLNEIDKHVKRTVESRSDIFKVALVGYTNAGKTSLLNALTGADEYVEDKLFATLDTRTRQLILDEKREIVISDTVGFIKNIPHKLVESFKATLEEVKYADLLLHVVDSSHPDATEHVHAVNVVLEEIGCTDSQVMLILNKADLNPVSTTINSLKERYSDAILVSAKSGQGLDDLKNALIGILEFQEQEITIELEPFEGKKIAWLNDNLKVLNQGFDEGKMKIKVLVRGEQLGKLKSMGYIL